MEFTEIDPIAIQQIIDSVNSQKKLIEEKEAKEYVDLGSDFIQEKDKEKLEDFITSLYE